jgi:GGDEF domain-containing protein
LDNFKPFNDKFGFRQDDRAILLFADTIKEESARFKPFLGHIGGNDFFIGYKAEDNGDIEDFEKTLKTALKKFAQNAKSFYSKEDRKAGFITAKDRFEIMRNFDLLSASCAAITIGKEKRDYARQNYIRYRQTQKKRQKLTPKIRFVKIMSQIVFIILL